MDIRIVKQERENLYIVIYCGKIDDEAIQLKAHIESFGRKPQAKIDNELYFVNFLAYIILPLPWQYLCLL